jgi:hypothetical protein
VSVESTSLVQVKRLGISNTNPISLKNFNALWDVYSKQSATMTSDSAKLFLKDWSVVCGVDYTDDAADKLLHDIGASAAVRKADFRRLFKNIAVSADAELTASLIAHVDGVDDVVDAAADNEDEDDDDDADATTSTRAPGMSRVLPR